jgi:hypothetical protein
MSPSVRSAGPPVHGAGADQQISPMTRNRTSGSCMRRQLTTNAGCHENDGTRSFFAVALSFVGRNLYPWGLAFMIFSTTGTIAVSLPQQVVLVECRSGTRVCQTNFLQQHIWQIGDRDAFENVIQVKLWPRRWSPSHSRLSSRSARLGHCARDLSKVAGRLPGLACHSGR